MYATDLILGFSHQTIALLVMGICYILLFTEKMNRAVITIMLGASLVMMGVISQKQAFNASDFNTLSLLAGMMMIINVAERSGMFQFVAIWGAKLVKANPLGILIMIGFVESFL